MVFFFFKRQGCWEENTFCCKGAVYEGFVKELREVSRRHKDIQVCSSGERPRAEMKMWASASVITQKKASFMQNSEQTQDLKDVQRG